MKRALLATSFLTLFAGASASACTVTLSITAHGIMTCEEAKAWLAKLPTMYAVEERRIESGVQRRILETVGEFDYFKRHNKLKMSDRVKSWSIDVAHGVSTELIGDALDDGLGKIKDFGMRGLGDVDKRGLTFLFDHAETVEGLIENAREGVPTGSILGEYAGETTLQLIEASGKAAPFLAKATPYLTAGKIAINVAASTGDAYLDIDGWREENKLLDDTTRRLIEGSPAVQMQLLRETEATLREMVDPAVPVIMGPDLGGVLVAVFPEPSGALDAETADEITGIAPLN